MKKILKSKKGFTLIELLAVIVVLAIIMVIATQQVNSTIKKSRGNTYYETVQNIRKAAQLVCAQDNKINKASLDAAVDYKDVDVRFSESKNIIVKPISGGKFDNMNTPDISAPFSYVKGADGKETEEIQFEVECTISAEPATE